MSKVMHGVSIFNLAAYLQIYCNTEYIIAVGFDAPEYVPVVADCI